MVTECSKTKLNAQKFTLRFFPRTEPWIDDRHDIPDDILANHDPSKAIPPLYGALIKNEQDVQLLERLAFMHRRETAGKN